MSYVPRYLCLLTPLVILNRARYRERCKYLLYGALPSLLTDIFFQAPNDYVTVAKACLAVPACVGITSWGVRDPVRFHATQSCLCVEWLTVSYRTPGGLLRTHSCSMLTSSPSRLTLLSSKRCRKLSSRVNKP